MFFGPETSIEGIEMFSRKLRGAEFLRKATEDPRLSLAAKGIVAYIVAHPKDWSLDKAQRASQGTFTAAYQAWRQLVQCGYVEVKSS